MIGSWLKPSPYGGYTITGKWRAWALLACLLGTTYQVVFRSTEVYWTGPALRVRGGLIQRSVIDLADLGEVQLLATLPAPTRRLSGLEIGGRARGTFEIPELGTVDLFLDGEAHRTCCNARGEARTVVLNACTSDASRELFERIRREVAEHRRAGSRNQEVRSRSAPARCSGTPGYEFVPLRIQSRSARLPIRAALR